jgi:phosphoserine phosphatase RsbU/P
MDSPLQLLLEGLDGTRTLVALDKPQFILGRSATVELAYPDDVSLSRQHLSFTQAGGEWWVEDLGSKNGSFFNGRKLEDRLRLQPGDRVSAGRLTMSLFVPAAEEQTVLFVEPEESTSKLSTTVVANLANVLSPAAAADMDNSDHSVLRENPQTRALVRAGRELSGMRPLAELFDLIIGLSVDAVSAQRGLLMIVDGDKLEIRAHRGGGFRISSAVRDRVIQKKESLLMRDAQVELDPSEQRTVLEQKVHSMLAVPLQTDDRVIGMIYLDTPARKREFTRDDLNLLTVMANVAAIRVEHARLAEVEATERKMEEELRQAANIQRGLLPTSDPEITGLDIAGSSLPCRGVGGDYYDYIPFDDGRLGLLVGDVAGKGISAALLMTSLQARVRVLFDEPEGLADRMARLNRAVCSNCPGNRFITFFAAFLNPVDGTFQYTNAGHNPPLLIRASGAVEQLDTQGLVLGIMPRAPYAEATQTLNVGDLLVLYSDGVTEAADPAGEEFGEQRLGAIAAEFRHLPSIDITTRIHADLTAFTQGAPPADDITLVVIRKVA